MQKNNISGNSISYTCAAAAFYAALSLPTFAALVIIVYKTLFGMPPELTAIILSFLPDEPQIAAFVSDLLTEITTKANHAVLSLSTAALLYSASHFAAAIRSVINRGRAKPENLPPLRRKIWCAGVSAAAAATATALILLFVKFLLPFGAEPARDIAVRVIIALSFVLLRFLTGGFVGSAVGLVCFFALGELYTLGAGRFLGYSVFYGSFAAVAMSMMWLYLVALILFASAYVQEHYRSYIRKIYKWIRLRRKAMR